jgi:hypothetical protein
MIKPSYSDNQRKDRRPPVIILGAARSGTKLLRGLIAATGCYAEVPYDVNYIWRYGNEACPHDALLASHATDRVRKFIRLRLRRLAANHNTLNDGPPESFVEKSVSNVLRLPFVRAIFPEAKYIEIARDGRDVVESAERSWREPPQAGYLLAKLHTFPWLDCMPYGWKYLIGAVRRQLRIDDHLRTWGPRYPGIDSDLARLSLLDVCAHQWAASVEHCAHWRHLFEPGQFLEVRYEELIRSPQSCIQRFCDFLEVPDCRPVLDAARRTIRADRIGARCRLSACDARRVLEIIGPALRRRGYSPQAPAHAA